MTTILKLWLKIDFNFNRDQNESESTDKNQYNQQISLNGFQSQLSFVIKAGQRYPELRVRLSIVVRVWFA